MTWGANSTVKVSIDQHRWYGLTAPGCDCQHDIGQVLVDVGQLKTQQTHQHASCHLFLPHLLQAGDQGVTQAQAVEIWKHWSLESTEFWKALTFWNSGGLCQV